MCVPAILALGKEAASAGKTFAINLSAPFIPEFFKDALDQILPYADIVIGNETEVAAWGKAHALPTDPTDLQAIARAIADGKKENKERKRVVVVTQGTEKTLVATQGGEGVKEFEVRVVPKEEICDTNGAGDAFAGGFMAGVVEGRSVEDCVDMGHWLASLGVRELGPAYVIRAFFFFSLSWLYRLYFLGGAESGGLLDSTTFYFQLVLIFGQLVGNIFSETTFIQILAKLFQSIFFGKSDSAHSRSFFPFLHLSSRNQIHLGASFFIVQTFDEALY